MILNGEMAAATGLEVERGNYLPCFDIQRGNTLSHGINTLIILAACAKKEEESLQHDSQVANASEREAIPNFNI
jgi:hypothetical protein